MVERWLPAKYKKEEEMSGEKALRREWEDNMDRETHQKVQEIILQYLEAIHAQLIHSHDDVFLTDKILREMEELGYRRIIAREPYRITKETKGAGKDG